MLDRDTRGRAVVVYTELETAMKRAKATLRIAYDEPHRINWVMQKGNVPAFEGEWLLRIVTPQTTEVEYTLMIDFGRMGRLIRGPAGKALANTAVSSMPGRLKDHVETALARAA